MRYFLLYFCVLNTVFLFGQARQLMVYDFNTQQLDSLPLVAIDTSVAQANTPSFIGTLSNLTANLPTEIPTGNTYERSDFTFKMPVAERFSIEQFPVRASVRLFQQHRDSLIYNCSGMLVSRRHVLTAAHCVVGDILPHIDSLYPDGFTACFGYDNGVATYDCLEAERMYFFKDYNLHGEDFALLEFSENIGEELGWVGIGYHLTDDYFKEANVHRFSYPNSSVHSMSPANYNGDTLYYSYGRINLLEPVYLGFRSAFGDAGEGGASLIRQVDDTYISYGVATWSSNLLHNRIQDWTYYAFADLIKNDLTVSTEEVLEQTPIKLYPNPTSTLFYLTPLEFSDFKSAVLTDQSGRTIRELSLSELTDGVSVLTLATGVYYLRLQTTAGEEIVKKIVKVDE